MNHRPMRHPVILVLDSDEGLGPIAGVIKEMFGVQFNWKSTAPFYHVTDNLYVVKTPEASGQQTCIEDLFTPQLRATQLNGKTFNPASDIDPKTEYSKEVFAKSVVKANAAQVDFSGFDPLLDRISAAIADYASKA